MMNTDEKLVYMANQIASFFVSQGEAKAVPAIADHIRKFWDPEMRRRFVEQSEKPNIELHPYVREAVNLLKQTA